MKDNLKRIETMISRRQQWLQGVIETKTESLSKAVPGRLRIDKKGKSIQYYHRLHAEKCGTYIPRTSQELAISLAQKDYDERVLRAAKEELSLLRKSQLVFQKKCPEDIYMSLSSERRALVSPIELPDDKFVCQWESYVYERKSFRDDMPEFYTEKGERVRSKSEILIANTLKKMGIPYRYECPLKLERFGTIHPDFTVLHVRQRRTLYLEHLGMLDELGYAGNAVERINGYIRSGIYPGDQLFLTFETSRQPLNIKMLQLQFERYFM